MSLFLKDLPCRDPESFTRFHSPGAARQMSVRPTYTAQVDVNAIEIINDPIPLLIRRLSRLPKDETRKRSMPDDESEVPSYISDASKRRRQQVANQRQTTTSNSNLTSVNQSRLTTNSIQYEDEFS